jgi:hypothetical protein
MLRFDFTSQDYLRDPATGLARLRAAGPVVEVRFPIVGRIWISTTSEMAGRVLKDSETFTMRKDGSVAGLRWWMPASIRALAVSMLTMDEPDHTRLRSIGRRGLSPARRSRNGAAHPCHGGRACGRSVQRREPCRPGRALRAQLASIGHLRAARSAGRRAAAVHRLGNSLTRLTGPLRPSIRDRAVSFRWTGRGDSTETDEGVMFGGTAAPQAVVGRRAYYRDFSTWIACRTRRDSL